MTKGKTILEGNKCNAWRGKKVGDFAPCELWMNMDDLGTIAHYFNRKIIVTSPFLKNNSTSSINLLLHVPLKGNQHRSKQCKLNIDKDNRMWHQENRRTMNRIYVDPQHLIQSGKGFCIHYFGQHYQGAFLKKKKVCNYDWPRKISYYIFESKTHKKCCTVCNKMSWTM